MTTDDPKDDEGDLAEQPKAVPSTEAAERSYPSDDDGGQAAFAENAFSANAA